MSLSTPIRLPAQCGTAAAPAVHRALVEAIAAGAAPVVDAGEVENLGQAMLQLLLAAKAAAPAMTIDPASPAFAERIHALRLGAPLGLTTREA
ncbi:STAS domain-containing protein [Sphingomonas sp. LHG3443-2]|uniref:STAS domain-containing protein n=1 Tax=Sphingomonas sp. LHG3443-2 TaxID=2804639 RepID=UPI003CF14622